jgi:IS4 transposase
MNYFKATSLMDYKTIVVDTFNNNVRLCLKNQHKTVDFVFSENKFKEFVEAINKLYKDRNVTDNQCGARLTRVERSA